VFNWPAELQMDEDQSLRNIELLRILAEGCPRHPAYRAGERSCLEDASRIER